MRIQHYTQISDSRFDCDLLSATEQVRLTEGPLTREYDNFGFAARKSQSVVFQPALHCNKCFICRLLDALRGMVYYNESNVGSKPNNGRAGRKEDL